MPDCAFDLHAAARREMLREGFNPDMPDETAQQLQEIKSRESLTPQHDVRDLRHLLWSSIDNETSRDLDQVEYAESTAGGIRILVGIADVDSAVSAGSPIDRYAASETTSVYTPVRVFPMLPEALSTDLTSLSESGDRLAVVIDMVVSGTGTISNSTIYRALVRNRAQLTYGKVGDWLEGHAAPDRKVAASAELQAQLKLQDEAAVAMRAHRHRLGALNFDRAEPVAITTNGQVQEIRAARKTRANHLIEDFMIAVNEIMARTLNQSGAPSIRRVVKSPERWPRIVALASQYGEHLPEEPDSAALSAFLENRKAADTVHYPDLSLAVVKLMGPGEYAVTQGGESKEGHFGLAAPDYTHSTAPNRRFADLVTQRLIKSVIAEGSPPYTEAELEVIARNCTLRENAARKVERSMGKRVAAVAMQHRIGGSFAGVVTGVTPKGVFVRITEPPVEGILCRGQAGVDVGDQIRVTLLAADPEKGFIDFARV